MGTVGIGGWFLRGIFAQDASCWERHSARLAAVGKRRKQRNAALDFVNDLRLQCGAYGTSIREGKLRPTQAEAPLPGRSQYPCAGTQAARRATALSSRGVRMKVMGSQAVTPKRKPFRKRVSQNAPPEPDDYTGGGQHHSLPDDHIAELEGWAPSAMRTPILCALLNESGHTP